MSADTPDVIDISQDDDEAPTVVEPTMEPSATPPKVANAAMATPTVVHELPRNSPLRSKDVLLPLARVKTIMQSSPDIDKIGNEGLFLITKATELFIMYLTKLSQRHGSDQEIEYSDLAAVVKRKDSMEFLHDIIPKKIKFSEYQALMVMEAEKEEDDDFF